MRSGPRYKRGAELIGFTRIRVDRLIWHHAGGANLERHCRRTGSELGFVGTRCAQVAALIQILLLSQVFLSRLAGRMLRRDAKYSGLSS